MLAIDLTNPINRPRPRPNRSGPRRHIVPEQSLVEGHRSKRTMIGLHKSTRWIATGIWWWASTKQIRHRGVNLHRLYAPESWRATHLHFICLRLLSKRRTLEVTLKRRWGSPLKDYHKSYAIVQTIYQALVREDLLKARFKPAC